MLLNFENKYFCLNSSFLHKVLNSDRVFKLLDIHAHQYLSAQKVLSFRRNLLKVQFLKESFMAWLSSFNATSLNFSLQLHSPFYGRATLKSGKLVHIDRKNCMVSTSLNTEMKVKYCFCVLVMYKLTITEHTLPKYYYAFLVMAWFQNVLSWIVIYFRISVRVKFQTSNNYFKRKRNNFKLY